MTSDEIREAFLSYFESKGHQRVASSSLIPVGDPTLLLTNAGMVQFKSYFAGESEPPNRRLTSAQKSFRTVDIDEVGDHTHLTMFEMMGNFSIGDYFKDGAMEFAVECLEEAMKLPRERFAATVHETDDEAYELWQKHGIPAERIYRFGDADNWWGPAGDEGPTGPCAELHYDFRDERPGCGLDDCGPNCTNIAPETGQVCQRYVELWNLVFMQYYHNLDGSRPPLPSTGIDTGMGFERLVTVMQDTESFYETDLFSPLIERIEEASGKSYESDPETKYALRVVAEHTRSATFLIADGVAPGNEGRGYVLRRVVRRAIRHGRQIGLEGEFLGDLAGIVIEQMGEAYPELRNHREFVLSVLQGEEKRFSETLGRGLPILDGMAAYRKQHAEDVPKVLESGLLRRDRELGTAPAGTIGGTIAAETLEKLGLHGLVLDPLSAGQTGEQMAGQQLLGYLSELFEPRPGQKSNESEADRALNWPKTLSGYEAFFLWDTYGFPVEMTQEIAREHDMEVDLEGFEEQMEAQRERGRAAGQFGADRVKVRLYESLGVGATGFLGYEHLTASSVVVGLISNDEVVGEAREGEEVEVVLQETPFYPEGGGQVGDAGQISGPGGRVDVKDTQTVMPGLIVHFGIVSGGKITMGETVDAAVDTVRREDTARNHTATHMLHAALRQVLGAHVRQAGSLVAADRLRFDFSHVESMTADEIEQVQWLVNERVRQNVGLHKSEDTYASAIERGALAFFGDKYDDTVRLVEIANGEAFSFEVCGGTHVERTGELGTVYILGESSIGAGMRRIEAVSGRGAERLVRERFAHQDRIAGALQVPLGDVEGRIQGLLDELDELRRTNEASERKLSLQSAEGLLDQKQDVDGVPVLAQRVSASSSDALREMGDWLRDKMGSGVIVLGSVVNDQPVLVAMVTADLLDTGLNAAEIAKGAAKAIGGGGGGRPDVAQAGGRNADKLDEALGMVPDLVRQKVEDPASPIGGGAS